METLIVLAVVTVLVALAVQFVRKEFRPELEASKKFILGRTGGLGRIGSGPTTIASFPGVKPGQLVRVNGVPFTVPVPQPRQETRPSKPASTVPMSPATVNRQVKDRQRSQQRGAAPVDRRSGPVDPNEPCTCERGQSTGRKFKNCCGRERCVAN